jgi:hypothetical protein
MILIPLDDSTSSVDSSVSQVTQGLTDAKGDVIGFAKPAINTVAVPIAAVVIGCIMLFFIVGAVRKHRGGEEYQDKIIAIIICLVALVLVLSFPAWGWTMMGQ